MHVLPVEARRAPASSTRSVEPKSRRLRHFASRAKRLFNEGTPLASQPHAKWYHPNLCTWLALTYAASILVLVSVPTALWWSGSHRLIQDVSDTFALTRVAYNETLTDTSRSLAGDIQVRVTQHVYDRLATFLHEPLRILNLTVSTQQQGAPILHQDDLLHNWHVMWALFRFAYPELFALYYADSTGLFAGYGKVNNMTHQVALYRPPDNLGCPLACPPAWEYRTGLLGHYYVDDETGGLGLPLHWDEYDPRKRCWYLKSVNAKGRPSWCRPGLFSGEVVIGMDFAQAVSLGARTTVFGASVSLTCVTDFLQSAHEAMYANLLGHELLEHERVTFIVDRDGMMVASSRGLKDVLVEESPGGLRQRAWSEVDDAMIRAPADLAELWRGELNGSCVHGRFLSGYQGFEFGVLHWMIVSVVDLAEHISEAQRDMRDTEEQVTQAISKLETRLHDHMIRAELLCAFLIVALGLPVIAFLAHSITRPVHAICQDMKSIARLDFLEKDTDASSEESSGSDSSSSSSSPETSVIRRRSRMRGFKTFMKKPPLPIKEVIQMRDAFAAMSSGLKSFARYVDPHVMEGLMRSRQQATLSVQSTTVTIFFSDIANFTMIAEILQPDVFMELLGEYLDAMSIIIIKSQGTVGEFIGDAIMAWWNAPVDLGDSHTKIALKTALEQQASLCALRSKWCSNQLPEVRARMGLVRGTVLAGNIGCMQRMKYGLVGDSVNLASRLEGLCKRYGVEILIDGGTQAAPGVQEAFYCRLLDLVVVKGRTGTTELYELVAAKPDPEDTAEEEGQSDLAAFVADFAMIHGMYRQANFQGALAAIQDYREKWPRDRPAAMLLERCERYLASPPGEGWSPVEKLTEK